jgi:hypothetical protein
MGLIFPVLSYDGALTISVTSCREMMPDPELFAQCLQDSYDELRDAALGTADNPGDSDQAAEGS